MASEADDSNVTIPSFASPINLLRYILPSRRNRDGAVTLSGMDPYGTVSLHVDIQSINSSYARVRVFTNDDTVHTLGLAAKRSANTSNSTIFKLPTDPLGSGPYPRPTFARSV